MSREEDGQLNDAFKDKQNVTGMTSTKKMQRPISGFNYVSSNGLKHVENQFLKWVLDWESRVFPSVWKGQYQYCFDISLCKQMDASVKDYLSHSGDELGQDRLAWTVFAKTLLREHRKLNQCNSSNSLKRCLYLLIWISYYLQSSDCQLVEKVLREILISNQSLKFLFTFLPGMSISLYISKFWKVGTTDFEDIFCKEFFTVISENGRKGVQEKKFYQFAQPLIYYQVSKFRPFHSERDMTEIDRILPTLISLLNRKIFPHCRYNLLTLAIKYCDIPLINLLLKTGVSAGIRLWDPVREETITPERMMISTINSVMMSKTLLSSHVNISPSVLNSVHKMKDNISSYARMLNRSLVHPECQKASSTWDGGKWKIELNKEIADEWGIGFCRPLPTLQHIAKISIRQQILIADCQLLPRAINELPIPFLLKSYLNLELD